MACPFCARIAAGDVTADNALAVAFPDAFPLTPGHTLVVPRRHEPDFLALSGEERQAVLALAVEVAARLRAERAPDGYNLGVNVGPAGGQTVAHAHLHVIPRYGGDVADPRGGIRWIIPERARYWEAT
ncbi:MAG TPA: HIT family protein [Dehalococcoidia bacterium]|nr:HIT family protein [Dehalococcoidia bacterium]